jgi:hypothetical protein
MLGILILLLLVALPLTNLVPGPALEEGVLMPEAEEPCREPPFHGSANLRPPTPTVRRTAAFIVPRIVDALKKRPFGHACSVPPRNGCAASVVFVITEATITCPACGFAKVEAMPTDACRHFYVCEECAASLTPRPGDCCVFCSFSDHVCPPKQAAARRDLVEAVGVPGDANLHLS